jgi:hypothetical protein
VAQVAECLLCKHEVLSSNKNNELTLLQYVDDILLCRATEPLISRASESLLNFLASWGYKVSKEKAQLCLPQVTYLGMILKGQTCSLSHEQIELILRFPPSRP